MTQQEAIVTIDLGDSDKEKQLAFSEVRKIIGEYLDAANFAMAVSVSRQLADQRPRDLWPQLAAAESLYLHQQIELAARDPDGHLPLPVQEPVHLNRSPVEL